MKNYIVEHDLSHYGINYSISVRYCNTVEDLARYLDSNPHPKYHLVSVNMNNGSYTLIWELTK